MAREAEGKVMGSVVFLRNSDGTALKVTQKTNYPWDGGVGITVNPVEASEFTFYLRVPGWADQARVEVNSKSVTGAKPGEYLAIHRLWSPGDLQRFAERLGREGQ